MICVLTYNKPHRKTYDLLCLLKANGVKDVHVIALPWEDRPERKPLLPHRPEVGLPVSPKRLSYNLGYKYSDEPKYMHSDLVNHHPDCILIAGAGILPVSITTNYIVINSHPGILPYVRGLDALKWAILEGHPIGITLYQCADVVDTGILIYKKELELRPTDTFYSVAQRLYEMEITALADAAVLPDNIVFDSGLGEIYEDENAWPKKSPVHRRMSIHQESMLEDILRDRILKYSQSH